MHSAGLLSIAFEQIASMMSLRGHRRAANARAAACAKWHGTIHHSAPTLEKQCLRSRMNAFSCCVLRAVVRHTAWQYWKGVDQWPVSGLRPGASTLHCFGKPPRSNVARVPALSVAATQIQQQCSSICSPLQRSVRSQHPLVAAAVHRVHELLRLVLRLEAAGHAVLVLTAALVVGAAAAGGWGGRGG